MSESMRIIFVDDEERVLRALSKALRHQKGWEMSFVDGGVKALDLMASQQFDVIVSDMRMPGMSGEQLLSKVREQYPEVSRIVLSGQCDQETAFRLVGSDHLYLSKPCPTDLLVETIKNAYLLQRIGSKEKKVLSNQELQTALCDMASMLLMRDMVKITDIPEILIPFLSEAIVSTFAPEIEYPFPEGFERVFEDDYDWTEDLK